MPEKEYARKKPAQACIVNILDYSQAPEATPSPIFRDRSSEQDAVSDLPQPAGGELGVGNRLQLQLGVGSRRREQPPLAGGRCTNASVTPPPPPLPPLVDNNIGPARRAATLLDRLALVMVGLVPWGGVARLSK